MLVLAGIAGLATGGGLALTIPDDPEPAVATLPAAAVDAVPAPASASPATAAPVTTAATTSTAAPPTTASPTTTTTAPAPPVSDEALLVWTPGRLPAGFADAVAGLAGVEAVTVVRAEQVGLVAWTGADGLEAGAAPAGFEYPVEAGAFDPASYGEFVAPDVAAALAGLGPGEVLLGETAARLRGIGAGGGLELAGGTRLAVRGVVPDVAIGGVEIAVAPGTLAEVDEERYLLASYRGERAELEAAIVELLPAGVAARVRFPGETPVLRHGDAVLPQVAIKEAFGEFAIRPSGGGFEVDPAWVDEHVVAAEVPLLGRVVCHRDLLPALRGAMEEVERRNLAFLVDPEGFRGCFNPRFIAGRRDPSRHAWGVAVDLNFGANPTGRESAQDPRLVAVMERWGFTSGHDWLIPDPGHFEYLRPPAG